MLQWNVLVTMRWQSYLFSLRAPWTLIIWNRFYKTTPKELDIFYNLQMSIGSGRDTASVSINGSSGCLYKVICLLPVEKRISAYIYMFLLLISEKCLSEVLVGRCIGGLCVCVYVSRGKKRCLVGEGLSGLSGESVGVIAHAPLSEHICLMSAAHYMSVLFLWWSTTKTKRSIVEMEQRLELTNQSIGQWMVIFIIYQKTVHIFNSTFFSKSIP